MTSQTGPVPESARVPDIRPIMALAWVCGVLFVFLVAYKGWLLPFSLAWALTGVESWETGKHWGSQFVGWAGDLSFLMVTMALATGWGALVVARLVPRKNLLGLLFALGMGLGLLAVGVMAVGMVSIGFLSLLWIGLAIWIVPGPRWFVRMTAFSTEKTDWWSRCLMLGLMLLVGLSAWMAVLPATDSNALGYHLRVPLVYLSADRVAGLPLDMGGPMSECVEMIYLACLGLRGDVAAGFVHWMFGVLAAAAVCAVGTMIWSRAVGWMAAAFFYVQPLVHQLGQAPRVELATTFYGVVAFGCMLAWWKDEEDRDDRYLWMSALAAGMAVATAWVALSVVVAPLWLFLLVSCCFAKDKSRWRVILRVPVFLMFAALPVLPWLVKCWWFSGDLARVFSPGGFAAMREAAGLLVPGMVGLVPVLDWFGVTHVAGGIVRFSLVDARALPLLLMVAPLTFFYRKLEPTVRHAAWLLLAAYGGWLLGTDHSVVMLLPSSALAAWIGAYGVERFCRRGILRIPMRAAVALMIGLGMMMSVVHFLDSNANRHRAVGEPTPVPYLMGQISRDELLARMNNGSNEGLVWMNQSLPSNARVLFIAEESPLYARVSLVWGAPLARHPVIELLRDASSVSFMKRLQQRKITHVYLDLHTLERLKRTDWGEGIDPGKLEMFLQRHATVRHNSGNVTVYELNP